MSGGWLAGFEVAVGSTAAADARLAAQRAFIACESWARRSGDMLGRFLTLARKVDGIAVADIRLTFSVKASWLSGVVKVGAVWRASARVAAFFCAFRAFVAAVASSLRFSLASLVESF